jgi:hypothetical protein
MKPVLGTALALVVVLGGLPVMGQSYPVISEGQRIKMLKPACPDGSGYGHVQRNR